jgi:hypothetical protein
MASEGIAHGKSDDFACSPPWPEANRRVTRGLTLLTAASWMARASLRDEERSIVCVQDN